MLHTRMYELESVEAIKGMFIFQIKNEKKSAIVLTVKVHSQNQYAR